MGHLRRCHRPPTRRHRHRHRHRTTRSAHIPFTPLTKKVLEQSLQETSLLGHDRIGTEHLLLALIDNRHSAHPRLLREAAPGDITQLRPHLLRQVAEAEQHLDAWMRERILDAHAPTDQLPK